MCLTTILFRFMQSILPLSAGYKVGVGRGSQYVLCQESNVAGGNAGDIGLYWLQQSHVYCV